MLGTALQPSGAGAVKGRSSLASLVRFDRFQPRNPFTNSAVWSWSAG